MTRYLLTATVAVLPALAASCGEAFAHAGLTRWFIKND
jgi:hypothetical protein